MPKSPRQKADEFISRVKTQTLTLRIPEKEGDCLLELLQIEIHNPTNSIDATSRYKQVIKDYSQK